MATDPVNNKHQPSSLIEVLLTERQRIGYEIHDNLGQRLTGIALLTASLKAQSPQLNSEQATLLEEIINQLSDAISETRTLAHQFKSTAVSELERGLRQLDRVISLSNIRCALVYEPASYQPDEYLSRELLAIAQQAVANVIEHAKANSINIKVISHGDCIQLEISDDGIGFDPDNYQPNDGIGLQSMRYRAHGIGAIFEISSAAGQGTRIRCRINRSATSKQDI